MQKIHVYLTVAAVLLVAVLGYYFGKNAAMRAFTGAPAHMEIVADDGVSVPVQEGEESVMPPAPDLPADAGDEAAPLNLEQDVRPIESDVNPQSSTLLDGDPSLAPPVQSVIADAPASALTGTHWTLVTLAGRPVAMPPERAPSLTLDEGEGRAFGSTGCNRYTGGYELDGASLSFPPNMAVTRMACLENMEIDGQFTQALSHVRGWQLDAGILSLLDEQGTTLATFAAGPSDISQ